MAKEVPSVEELTDEDFVEVADLAFETPEEVVAEVIESVEAAEDVEIFSAVEAEVEVEVESAAPAANPARVRVDGGIVVASSRRRP